MSKKGLSRKKEKKTKKHEKKKVVEKTPHKQEVLLDEEVISGYASL